MSIEVFWVLVAVLIFFGIVFGFGKAHKTAAAGLDARAERIRGQLDEARKLREAAQGELASFERKRKEAEAEAQEIVARAKEEAKVAAVVAQKSLEESIARRLKSAEERIAQAEMSATREVKNASVQAAIAAVTAVMSQKMGADQDDALIESGIQDLAKRLN